MQGCAAATSLLPPRVASARVLHLPISAAFGVSSPRVRRMGLAQLGGSPCTVVSVSCLRCKRSGYTSGLPAPRDWILVVHSHDDARNGNGGHIPSFFFFLCAFANYNAKVIHQEVGSFILMCNGGRAEVHVSARSCSRAVGKSPQGVIRNKNGRIGSADWRRRSQALSPLALTHTSANDSRSGIDARESFRFETGDVI